MLTAVVAVPAAVVLLIGGAMSSLTLAPVAVSPGAGPSGRPSSAASAFSGVSGGCTVADPSGTGGCVTPAMAWLYQQMGSVFGSLPTSCWDAHAWNPSSDHPRGRACDVTFGHLGSFPDEVDTARGWQLAIWLRANAPALHVAYVIWAGRIWSSSHDAQGWRPYSGGGIYDPSEPTGGHYDHVHVSTRD